jgi:Zn-dependent protease
MKKQLFILCLLLLFLAHSVTALDFKQIFIDVDRNGDAAVTVSYQSNPVEYAGVKIASVSSDQILNEKLSSAFKKTTTLDCTQPGTLGLKIKKFATITGNNYQTPEVNLETSSAQDITVMGSSFNLRTDVVIVFPDGYYKEEKNTAIIHAVTHTIVPNTTFAPVAPRTECRKKEPLPLSGIIPEEAEPVAAVATGVAVTGVALGTTTMGSTIASIFEKLFMIIRKFFGQKGMKVISEKTDESKVLQKVTQPPLIFGFMKNEILVITAGIIILSFAYLIAKRKPFDPMMILIFFVMVGFALAIHEVTHAIFSIKFGHPSEFRFWGLGSLFLFIGGWLFGTTFSQPYLTITGKSSEMNIRNRAIVKLSGPVVSLVIAIICFYMIPFATNTLALTALSIGLSVNLLTCVYSLIPVTPLDGKDVFEWNRFFWAILFIPLLILYILINI